MQTTQSFTPPHLKMSPNSSTELKTNGAEYCLKLNQDKCEALTIREEFSETASVFFKNGEHVKQQRGSKYLGCFLNNKTDSKREVNKRMADVFVTWKKLETDCSVRFKLIVYDAVVRAKLVYGLESAQLNDDVKAHIDAFQRKGLRKS